jgi:hypothetical protein
MTTYALTLWKAPQPIDHQPSGALLVVRPEQPRLRFVPSQELTGFFSPEQYFQSQDIDESIHFCAEYFAYNHWETSIAKISMDETFVLTIEGQQYHMTEKATSDLCRILDIPFDFVRSIPTDLTALIVQRLKSLHTQSVIVIARKNIIVAFVDPVKWAGGRGKPPQERVKKKPHYQPVPNLSLLRMLEKVWSGQDVDTRITLADGGMQVEFLQNTESFRVEPVVGDVTRVGVAMTNSETGGPLPVAKGYTLRLSCTNGATVRINDDDDDQRRGFGRFSSDWRCSLEHRFDRFTNDLRCLMESMQLKCGALQMAYQRMIEAKVDDVQFHTWYGKAQYLYRSMANSSEYIDCIFGVEPDERQALLKRERKWQKAKRAVRSGVIEPPQFTDLIPWEVFNGVTAAARDEMHYYRRSGLESLASDIVSAFMPSLN